MLFEEVGFQVLLDMGRDSAILNLGGCWLWKSLDWAEWELHSRMGGTAKRPEVSEQSARVGV